jgi:hypothetical protein
LGLSKGDEILDSYKSVISGQPVSNAEVIRQGDRSEHAAVRVPFLSASKGVIPLVVKSIYSYSGQGRKHFEMLPARKSKRVTTMLI